MSSLSIGKNIVSVLNSNTEAKKYFNGRIYPLIAEQGTSYPFIVYRRASLEVSSNKDVQGDIAHIEVTVISNTYKSSIDGIEIVRTALENSNLDLKIEGANEYFSNDGYIQELQIKIEDNK